MESTIKIFSNSQFGEIRTTTTENNEPLFCLGDLCRILEIKNTSDCKARLNEKGIAITDTLTSGGVQKMIYVDESNLYKVIFQSRKQEAESFTEWVTSEVLPSIRKSGGYMIAKQDETPDELMARAVLLAQETISRLQSQQKTLEAKNQLLDSINKDNMPKVLFASAVEASDRSCLVGELAKVLNQNGISIGQNRLFEWLRQNHYLCGKGEYYNRPTQRSMEMGLFELKQTSINKPDGTILVSVTTKVTGKGQIYFVNKFIKKVA